MSCVPSGHRSSVRRYLWPAVVISVILLVLGIMLAIGIIRGDETDIERRQEEPANSAPLLR